jgi:hypothetical protein
LVKIITNFNKFINIVLRFSPGVREKCTLPFHGLFLCATL